MIFKAKGLFNYTKYFLKYSILVLPLFYNIDEKTWSQILIMNINLMVST